MHKLTILPLFHPFFSSLILFLWIWFFVLFFYMLFNLGLTTDPQHAWLHGAIGVYGAINNSDGLKNDCIYKRQADSMMATVMWEDVLQYHLIFVLIVLLSTFRKIQA